MNTDKRLNDCIQEVLRLSLFKTFCEKNDSVNAMQRLRNIYAHSANPIETTKNLVLNELQEHISSEDAEQLYLLITAFLKKSNFRKAIPESIRNTLLTSQNKTCAICGKTIDIHAPVDHIIPFKYVGDELSDNYQMLCETCNSRKNSSIDFQIRYLLKSI